jgi:predicted MFS family arabinose efflux permease
LIRHAFGAFESRDFRLMWAGACTSSVGTWMQKLAQSWLVLQLSGSPFLLGLDAFLGEIPIFLFSLFGGVVADRIDRRRILIWSQIVQLSCAFLLAAMFAFNVVHVWHILALSFVVGIAQSFGGPAYQALIPSIVQREHIPNAIAMNSIQFNLARIIGPVLGGLALNGLGAAWCFGLNGVSYIAVIMSLLAIRPEFKPAPSTDSVWTSMRDGIGFIRAQQGMVSLIVLAFLMTMLGIPMIVFLPAFARDVYHKGAETYTLLLVVQGAGSILGALLIAGLGRKRGLGRQALITLTILGVLMMLFALTPVLLGASIFLFFAGAALIMSFSQISSLVQFVATDEMRGRVMSVYNVAFRGGMPIGSLITGALVGVVTTPWMVAANGILLVLLGLYLLLVHRKVAAL